jgi:hypothetical protein
MMLNDEGDLDMYATMILGTEYKLGSFLGVFSSEQAAKDAILEQCQSREDFDFEIVFSTYNEGHIFAHHEYDEEFVVGQALKVEVNQPMDFQIC